MNELLIIIGPTAVGKTDIALTLAEKLNAEIISADSMQVYRGMDIGTAKPTPVERSRVPHHLIDVAEPGEEFSVGDYLTLTEAAIEDIKKRGKLPFVVGGTGLYVRALSYGLFEGPVADWALRDSFIEREQREGPGTLHKELEKADLQAASRIHPSDIRRIIRALEVYHKGGQPISKRHEEHKASSTGRPVRIAGLTRARGELYSRIETRVDAMMEAGFLDEVKALKDMGCKAGMVSMQAIGYKHLMAYLEGVGTLEETVRLIKRDTKRFAKRQFTWFNADKKVRWVDITGSRGAGDALPALEKALEIFPIIR